MRSVLLVFLLFLGSVTVQAQYVIKGKVIGSDDRQALPQVTVLVTGTDQGVPTDVNGEFTLEVTSKDITLTFRYLGYITQKVRPKFSGINLIRLKPDCIYDHFRNHHLKPFVQYDFSNKRLGGYLYWQLPYPVQELYAEAEHTSFDAGRHASRFGLTIRDIRHGCDWELNGFLSYKNYQLNNLNFESMTIAAQIELGNWANNRIMLGVGQGRSTLEVETRSMTGLVLGFQNTDIIGNWTRAYIPIEITATYWQDFWDLSVNASYAFDPVYLRLSFHRIKGFSQFQLGVGTYIRLRKLRDEEKARRKEYRKKRRERNGSGRGRHISE